MNVKTAEAKWTPITRREEEPLGVKMHPIALLSIVDHFERSVGKKRNKRALGVLLGERNNGILDVTNSYAIPFDEAAGDEGVFYLDHNYHETMARMFRKINIKENILGWYVTGAHYKPHDLEINEIFAGYTESPVLVTCDVLSRSQFDLPTKAFFAVEQVDNKGLVRRNFRNLPCKVEAFEPEEVGVEHLIRELRDLNMDTLQHQLSAKVQSLVALKDKVLRIAEYLESAAVSRKKMDQQIMFALQRIISLLPKVLSPEMKRAMASRVNENYLALYVSGIVKSVVAIHSLLNNRIRPLEDSKEKKEKVEKERKQKEKDEKEKKQKEEKEKEKEKKGAK